MTEQIAGFVTTDDRKHPMDKELAIAFRLSHEAINACAEDAETLDALATATGRHIERVVRQKVAEYAEAHGNSNRDD